MSEAEKTLLNKVKKLAQSIERKRWIEAFHGWNVTEQKVIIPKEFYEKLLQLEY